MGGKRVRVRSRRSASNIQVVSLLQLFAELLLLYYIYSRVKLMSKKIFDNEDKLFLFRYFKNKYLFLFIFLFNIIYI